MLLRIAAGVWRFNEAGGSNVAGGPPLDLRVHLWELAIREDSPARDGLRTVPLPATKSVPDYSGADLSRADMSGRNLKSADCRGTRFQGAKVNSLDLCSIDAADANFDDSFLQRSRLRGSDLSRASLEGARLIGCDFRRANLSQASLVDAVMTVALTPASWPASCGYFDDEGYLSGASKNEDVPFLSVDLEGANLRGADFGPLILVGRVSIGADCREIFLWTSVLGGQVAIVGFMAFDPGDLCTYASNAGPLGKAAASAVRYLQTLVPLAMARRSKELRASQ